MIISVSAKPCISEPLMLECGLTTDQFMDIFKPENVKQQATKDGRNYIAGRLLDYSKPRGKGNVVDRCAVVLDCDDADKAGIDKLVEAVKALGVRSVVHSTYSSTPDKPRVRVVIPLKNAVTVGDYTALCEALMSRLNMVKWDETCAQAERAMYMPAKPEGGEYWAKEMGGPLMDGLEWMKTREPKARKARTSKGNVAKRDRRRKPENDPGIQGAFNRVYTIEDAIEEFDLPYDPCRENRWTYYESHAEGGLRLVEGREDLCISEHANTDPACFVDGNGSVRALSAFELCAVHLYGEDDDTSLPPRERASMLKMAKHAAEDEAVRAELGAPEGVANVDVAWLREAAHRTRVVAMHVANEVRDRLAYVKGFGWMAYAPEEGVWEPIDEGGAVNRVNMVAEAWEQAAMVVGDETVVKKVRPFCGTHGGRSILVHLQEMVTHDADDFDADLDLLCVKNGVVDLRTSKLMPHDPKYLMMKRSRVNYVPGATRPAWGKALEALSVDQQVWLQYWVGCALTGYQPDDRGAAVPFLVGSGSNGKSVIMTALARVFGDYGHVGSHDLLMPNGGKDLLRACAPLKGVRLCIMEEAPDKVIYGNALKQLAATPTMKGEYKFKSEFTFTTTHSLMVSTNNKLRVDEGTTAVERRLAILSFDYEYGEYEDEKNKKRLADPNLLRELETPEAQEATLAWGIEGAKMYFAAGQHVQAPTEAMRAAKDEWLGSADVLTSFFNEMLIEDSEAMIPWTHLCAAFADWQDKERGRAWNNATLKGRVSMHRLFSQFKFGKIRTTGMSLYCDGFGNGPKAPKGSQVSGVRGLRFRTDADGEAEAFEGEYVEPEPEVVVPAPAPVVVELEPEALIPAEDIPAPVVHSVPEKEEVERQGLIEEIEGLVAFVHALPGGVEEVNRLVEETGYRGPCEPLGKLRAFKIRLEGALVRLTIQYREEMGVPFMEDNVRRQE
jgi:P4 family phage/plasmid primase-like protien